MRVSAVILSLAATPVAGDFSLAQPIDCALGETCFIQQFLDNDPQGGARDYTCGSLTYDGHGGTDFALPSLIDQAAGVNVLAAASGTVTGVRDDMADVMQIGPDAPDITNRQCGNGLVIRHIDGFETQYCHMALGSIVVKTGQQVSAGDVLGQVGLSGDTQFPHLHLSVRRHGKKIDPFNTDGLQTCPDPTSPSLWAQELDAPRGGIISIGMADAVPAFDAIKAGTADTPATADMPAMVGWGHLFGVRAGDMVRIVITRPDSTTFEHTTTLDRTQARVFRAYGKRKPQGGWPEGRYNLAIFHLRGDAVIDQSTAVYSID